MNTVKRKNGRTKVCKSETADRRERAIRKGDLKKVRRSHERQMKMETWKGFETRRKRKNYIPSIYIIVLSHWRSKGGARRISWTSGAGTWGKGRSQVTKGGMESGNLRKPPPLEGKTVSIGGGNRGRRGGKT